MKKFGLLLWSLFLITSCTLKKDYLIDYGEKAEKIVSQSTKKVKVYVFAKKGCEACENANEFFGNLVNDKDYANMFAYNFVEIYDENWHTFDENSEQLMLDVASYFKDDIDQVPYIIVGEKSFAGYKEQWDDIFKKEIMRCYKAKICNDPVRQMLNHEIKY